MSDFFRDREIMVGKYYAFRKREQRDAAEKEAVEKGYVVVKGASDDGQFWLRCIQSEEGGQCD